MRDKVTGAQRWVVKIGSALLTADGRGLDRAAMAVWVEQMVALREQGVELVLVREPASPGPTRWGLHLLLFVLPWVRIGGAQALRFDLEGRRLTDQLKLEVEGQLFDNVDENDILGGFARYEPSLSIARADSVTMSIRQDAVALVGPEFEQLLREDPARRDIPEDALADLIESNPRSPLPSAVRQYLDPEEPFCFTYGDGLSDVHIGDLIQFHRQHGCIARAALPPSWKAPPCSWPPVV